MTTDDSLATPEQTDATLEPLDLTNVSEQQALFYLAGQVPISIDELADKTVHSTSDLRRYLNRDFQSRVKLDSTDFVRLTDSARNTVIRAAKPYIKLGQDQFAAAKSAASRDQYSAAAEHLERTIELFNQTSSRLESVNYQSKKLQQRLDTAQKQLAGVRERVGSSADQVTAFLNETESSSSQESQDTSSREAMLDIVRELHQELGRVPKTTDLPEETSYTTNDYYSEFGKWDDALAAAGINKEQALLNEIKRVAAELRRIPNTVDMDELGVYSGSNYSSYFGSWQTALSKADMSEEDCTAVEADNESSDEQGSPPNNSTRREDLIDLLQTLHQELGRLPEASDIDSIDGIGRHDFVSVFGNWDDALEAADIDKKELLIEEFQRVADEVDGVPSKGEMNRLGEFSAGMYIKYFDTWRAALDAADISTTTRPATGPGDNASGQQGSPQDNPTRRQELINLLELLHQKHGQLPKASDTHSMNGVSQHDFISVFGSWDDALEEAGIDKGQLLIDELQRIADELGGRPSTTEMNHLGEHSSGMYNKYFGSWDAALEAAGVSRTERSKTESSDGSPNQRKSQSGDQISVDVLHKRLISVGSGTTRNLKAAGYRTIDDLRSISSRDLKRIDGVGPTKAQSILEFVSDMETKHRQTATSNDGQSGSDDSHSVHPDTISSWEAIPDNERLDRPFLFEVVSVKEPRTDRKEKQLVVQDRDGREFKVNIWQKHDIDQDWTEWEWYALEQARGKVWDSDKTTPVKLLSSTKDLNIIELGANFEPDTVVGGEEPSDSGQTKARTAESQTTTSSSGATTSGTKEEKESDSRKSSTDQDEADVSGTDDGILDDIMSDFEDT